MKHVARQKRIKGGLGLLLAASIAVALSACGSKAATPGGGSAATNTKLTLGFSVAFVSNAAAAGEALMVEEAAKKAGIELLPPVVANGDAGKQISDIRTLIDTGAKALIVFPTDSFAIEPALAYAAQKNVPVVTIDIPPGGGKAAMIVRANNSDMSKQACERIGKQLNGQGKVIFILGGIKDLTGQERRDGFVDCMKQQYPGIQVIASAGTDWDSAKATGFAQSLLTANPDTQGIFLASDGVMLSGVLNLLKSTGKLKPAGEPGHILVASIDGTPNALKEIKAKNLDFAVAQPYELYGEWAITYLQKALKGEKSSEGKSSGINGSEIANYKGNLWNVTPAPLIDATNVDTPTFWANQMVALGKAS